MAPPNNTSGMEFEVFLSFRGPDTRDNFTSCLYYDMVEKGIRVFKDNEELRVGEQIGGKLLQALDDTQIYIPIFSKGFASSVWCLREVAHMVDCTSKSNGKKEILPLFFDVKPDDVKLRTELYSNALSEHEKKYEPDEVKRWKAALREVATRLGWKRDGKEYGELIKLIVQEVQLKLKVKNRSLPNHLVEVDDQKDIEGLLDAHFDGVRFVIIHGTGGIGKSTLAKVIFNRFLPKFNYSSFLEDVQNHGLLEVQKKLLSDILGSTSTNGIHDMNDGINRIRRGLRDKRVLVVIDNVDEKRQLETLAGGCDWFGSGSRIIVTVRDVRTVLNEDKQTRPSNYLAHPVNEMPLYQAILLFSRHAFRSDTPPKNWYNFSIEVVSSIGRLPLTLEVVGSLFARTNKSEWHETLKELKQVPHSDVRKSLMLTIKKLDAKEKAIFLDIACFCINEDKTYADYMWCSSGYSPRSAINVLLLMSLIKIDEHNCFWMHDEVRDLGRYIVKEENFEDAEKRRWVRIDENTQVILRSKEEKGAIQALSLDIRHHLTPVEIAHLPKLRFLGGKNLNFVGDFENVRPNLRWLSWHYCSWDFLATNLHLENLVVLNLSKSGITDDWGGWSQIKMANNLKILDLSYCYLLNKTPDFSEFGKLEKLILGWCQNLTMIDSSIGKLKLLSTLNIKGCTSLKELPEEIGFLECLSEILMDHMSKLSRLPETLGNLKSLTKFEVLYNHEITQIPHSIGRLSLTHLVLLNCKNLDELPNSIGELESLVELNLEQSRISVLPDSIGRLTNLKHLFLSDTYLHELPNSIGELESLVKLNLKYLRISVLPNSIGRLTNLQHLLLSNCNNLRELPDSIGELESLVKLDLEYSGIFILPDSIGRLINLQHLLLWNCNNLDELPNSIGELKLLDQLTLRYSRISVLPDSIGRLTNLKCLLLSNCYDLDELPNSIGELELLVKLNLEYSRISVLPNSFGRLMNLKHLSLSDSYLHELPDSIGELESLVELNLEFSRISVLPNSIGRLTNLKHLLLSGCRNLHELPDSIGELKSLVKLNLEHLRISNLPNSIGRLTNLEHLLLFNCINLHELPDSIGDLKALVILDLKFSEIFVLPTSIGSLKNLQLLLLYGCKNLLELPDSIGELESLSKLDLQLSGISNLPNSIGRLMNFTYLSFYENSNLVELKHPVRKPKPLELNLLLPRISILIDSMGRLTSFTHLSFSECKSIHKLLESIGQMELLVELNLKSSGISLLPNSIGNLKRLKVLNVAHTEIHTIPYTLGGVETLEELDASFCLHLMDEIPWEMWNLTRLRILDLDGSPISTVPRMINGFSSLQTLKVASCWLSPLPMLPSSLKCLVVEAAEFPVLPDLSNLVHLHHLEVGKPRMTFWVLAEVTSPWEDIQSVNRLPLSLSTLKLHSIPQLPDNFNFQSLLILSISKCLIAHLPDLSHLKGLQELRLSDFPELVEIPGLGELELLEFLYITMCDVIKQLPNLSKLKNLLRLELKHCAKLRAVEDLTKLQILKNVEIRYCMSLERLPDVSAFTKLETDWTPPELAEHNIQLAKRLRLSLG